MKGSQNIITNDNKNNTNTNDTINLSIILPKTIYTTNIDTIKGFWTELEKCNSEEFAKRIQTKSFIGYVWSGIPNELRAKLWRRSPITTPKISTSMRVSKDLYEQIVLETKSLAYCNGYKNENVLPESKQELLRSVLRIDSNTFNIEYLRQGCGPLLGRILSTTTLLSDIFTTYIRINEKLNYLYNDKEQLYNILLGIIDFIAIYDNDITKELQDNNIDVHDMIMIIMQWVQPLFSCHLSQEIVLRTIDIVLFDPDPTAIFGIVIGILKVIYQKWCKDDSTNKDFLLYLQELDTCYNDINDIFFYGYTEYRIYDTKNIIELKDWEQYINETKNSDMIIHKNIGNKIQKSKDGKYLSNSQYRMNLHKQLSKDNTNDTSSCNPQLPFTLLNDTGDNSYILPHYITITSPHAQRYIHLLSTELQRARNTMSNISSTNILKNNYSNDNNKTKVQSISKNYSNESSNSKVQSMSKMIGKKQSFDTPNHSFDSINSSISTTTLQQIPSNNSLRTSSRYDYMITNDGSNNSTVIQEASPSKIFQNELISHINIKNNKITKTDVSNTKVIEDIEVLYKQYRTIKQSMPQQEKNKSSIDSTTILNIQKSLIDIEKIQNKNILENNDTSSYIGTTYSRYMNIEYPCATNISTTDYLQINNSEKVLYPNKDIIKFSDIGTFISFPCIHMEGYLKVHRYGSDIVDTKTNISEIDTIQDIDNNNDDIDTNEQEKSKKILLQRFFVLHGSFFTQFETHTSLKPIKDISVDIRGCGIVAVDSHPDGPYAFEILNNRNERLYTLFTLSEIYRRRWIFSLVSVARLPSGPS